ncbi:MAG: hypothetical protein EI684_17310 [Candidatus Viridilinea halotolerans]|uniref:CRISPR type III-associated protein domain-containing protein n=1 Tax=Candidatus Viridilinea halotolerans TaxID=2491704 RepID=A0A426TU95_9CHLR|nr:MAG: hypothetical protein EI684_17310 [Candidatus Viridilinea halotolerans]
MNPYDFVRVIWQQPGLRRQGPSHDRFQGVSGRLEACLTAETPLFLPDRNPSKPRRFRYSNAQRAYFIPGSSLKGLFRSLVETVDGGAWWFINTWENKLPAAFQRPRDLARLDAACRMFGFMGEKGHQESAPLMAGHVSFEDAICIRAVEHEAINTIILLSPQPKHTAWYLDSSERLVAGRKFYFHARNAPMTSHASLGANIKPLASGSHFIFRVHFNNLAEDDFNLLLYALVLEPEMRHKFGYAKPAGLGSIHVQINWLETIDRLGRYRAGGGGITRYADHALATLLAARTATYCNNRTSLTLNDLRRIWAWPAQHDLRYPSREWFNEHSQDPLDKTP